MTASPSRSADKSMFPDENAMMMDRRSFLQTLGTAIVAGAAMPKALAQGNPIRILVGFPPGGLPDRVARAVAEQFKRNFGVSVRVDNKPGANGRLAGQAVKNAAADGTSFLVAPASGMVHLPHVYKDLGFDPLTDFVPIAQLVQNDFALAIHPKVPAHDLTEFAAWCRAHPDQATFGSPGTGSSPHLMGLRVAKALGIGITHVPYRGGSLALADLLGGHVSSMISSTSFLLQPHRTGQVRILATTGRARSATLPRVPTFGELGMAQLTLTEGTWLLAPAGMAPDLVDTFSRAALESIKSQEMQDVLDGQTVEAPVGARALASQMREEYAERGAQIKAFGFSAAL
ncbi:tripartite tricarboxylate transporter substrate-binding protein [Comamonadaceae bacterium G21597-S1]|nr:tripartite tricarboxylate transporter substrate-binding protein [Comamonadaceae bacterium G21597-S1]